MISLIKELHGPIVVWAGLINLFVGVWIVISKPRTKTKFSFAGTTTAIAGYLIFFGCMSFTDDMRLAFKLGWIGEIFVHQVSPWFYCFSVYFLDIQNQKKLALFAPLFGIATSVLVWNLNGHAAYTYWWGNFIGVNRSGDAKVFLYFLSFFGFMLASFRNFISGYNSSNIDPKKRLQVRYIILAFFIAYLGSWDHLTWLKFNIYPLGYIPLTCFVGITAYAVIQHELLELKIFFRRISFLIIIYFGLSLTALPIIVPYLKKILSNGHTMDLLINISAIVIVSTILSTGPLLYSYFVKRSAYFHEHTIAGLTHELKSPLGVIESATASLLDDMENPTIDKNKISDYLKMIQNNTNRLQTFAQNLIHAAKDQDDEVVIDKKPCDVSEIIRTACDHWRAQAERKNITLGYEGPKEAVIQGDPVKLHQIISNVLSNAVKFSERGKITVKLQKGAEQCLCEVRDGGKGIAPEHLKKVFNRFFQVHPGSKGTGIGLTIAKTWVEAHGGKIWAESEGEGKGTTMRFTLPN